MVSQFIIPCLTYQRLGTLETLCMLPSDCVYNVPTKCKYILYLDLHLTKIFHCTCVNISTIFENPKFKILLAQSVLKKGLALIHDKVLRELVVGGNFLRQQAATKNHS